MSERQQWPDSGNFIADFDVRLACAEGVVELLATYGRKHRSHIGDKEVVVTRTRAVDALNERDGRYQDALRVSECLYIHTNDLVAAGQQLEIRTIDEGDDIDYRAFALEFGTVDLDEVDCSEPLETATDYDWRSIALVVVEIKNDELLEPLEPDSVLLLDAETGLQLDDDRSFHLHSLIQAVGHELRSMDFSDTSLLDKIAKPELEKDDEVRFGREFRAADFIRGVDCDECKSGHVACVHNSALN